MILLAVTGWTVAIACAVTMGLVLAAVHELNCADHDRGAGALIIAAIPPLIVFAVYGIACWFGGHS